MSHTPYEQRRARIAHQLVSAIERCAIEHEANSLLIVTPSQNDAIERVMGALREGSARAQGDVELLGIDALDGEPQHREEDVSEDGERAPVRCVFGGAMLEGLGLANLSRAWREELDGAILVVFHRETHCVMLEECDRWLRDASVPVLGVVVSEECCPKPADRWLLVKQAMTRRLFFWRGRRVAKAHEVVS